MYGDGGKGIVVEYRYDVEYFRFVAKPDAHFDTEGRLQVWNYGIENVTNLLGVGEDAASTMLGGDLPHRASDVPIYLAVAHFIETIGNSNEFIGFLPQNLGYDGYGIRVVGGQNVSKFAVLRQLFWRLQEVMSERNERRYGKGNSFGEAFLVDAPEEDFRQSLHGCQYHCLLVSFDELLMNCLRDSVSLLPVA